MSKTLQNLNESDLRAIAAMVWGNNTWFDNHGVQVSLEELTNEIVGWAEEHAEMCDKTNETCKVCE